MAFFIFSFFLLLFSFFLVLFLFLDPEDLAVGIETKDDHICLVRLTKWTVSEVYISFSFVPYPEISGFHRYFLVLQTQTGKLH
jgi:hypothetical protein